MKEKELFKYYDLFKNLRMVQTATNDINKLQYVIDHFNRNIAIGVCSEMSIKYEAPINKIGSFFGGLRVRRGMKIYLEKTDKHVLQDLIFVRNCIIIYATITCGLERDYNSCLLKVCD